MSVPNTYYWTCDTLAKMAIKSLSNISSFNYSVNTVKPVLTEP